MQYLPIYPEKSWDDYWLSPTQQIWMERIEWLPLYSAAYNMMLWNTKQTQDLPAVARVFYSAPALPVWMLTDWLWQIWNTAVNGYKRLYNYWANAYNNIADRYNNWAMQGANPQTSLTWRKITPDMNPANYNLTITEVEKPEKYLQWVNWEIVAKIVDPNPTEIKVVPATEAVNNTDIKKTIAKWLSSLVKKWKVTDNVSKIQKLIDLYNKVK